jgi:hypothetical protein
LEECSPLQRDIEKQGVEEAGGGSANPRRELEHRPDVDLVLNFEN